MKLRFIQPFDQECNIGREYNIVVAEQPDDAWIILRDQDTLPFEGFAKQVYSMIQNNPGYDLIGCMTNRLNVNEQLVKGMFDEDSVTAHLNKAKELYSTQVKEAKLVAGLCMIFPKSTWVKVGGFVEKSKYFDRIFCEKIRRGKGRIGIATGLYLFHLYRYDKPSPRTYKKHLSFIG